MSARGRITVIDLDHERLSFVSGTVAPGKVRVARRGSAVRPAGVDSGDAKALGSWAGEQLRAAGVAAGKVLVCVPRGNVVMKRLAFPGLESHADPDLVAMVRLQMTRQMPMKVEGTTIDFVPLERALLTTPGASRGDGAGAAAGGSGMGSGGAEGPGLEVLACALPGDRLAWCRGVAEAADVRLEWLSLRASGAATLLAQAGYGLEGPVLGVSIGWSSVEFVVVRDGEIVFVRSADVPLADDVDAASYSERVAVEAKRTWMAYRVSQGAADVESVAVVGGGRLARDVATRCGEAMELSSATVELPCFVEDERGEGDDEAARAGAARSAAAEAALAPLIGLMVAQASDRPVIDFAHPRQPPDVGAGMRRLVLLGVLGAITVIGGGLVLADMRVRDTRAAAKRAETEAREWGGRVVDHMRADARLRHIEQWLQADVDWVAHWSKISDTMPRPPEALLDSLGGSLTAEVVFQPGGTGSSRTYANSRWNLDMQAVLHATGRLANRMIGNEFRERLVADPTYVVESRGADTENRFDMDLLTRRSSPEEAPGGVPGGEGPTEASRTAGSERSSGADVGERGVGASAAPAAQDGGASQTTAAAPEGGTP